MSTLAKLQPLIIIASAFVGIVLGTHPLIGSVSGSLIEPSLMTLLFFVFLSIRLSGVQDALKNIKLSGIALAMNFVWTPLFAMVVAKLLLGDSVALQIGFVMLLVTPCTDWCLVFTKMAQGNVEAAAALLPVNLIVQMVLLPAYLFVFMGSSISFSLPSLITGIATVLVIPLAIASLIKLTFERLNKRQALVAFLGQKGDAIQMSFLCLAICAMFASQGNLVLANPGVFLLLLAPLMLFFMTNYILTAVISKLAHFSYEDRAALTFTTLARNSPLALAVAISAFDHQPMVGLALVMGPLIELPVLAVVSQFLKRSTLAPTTGPKR